MSDDTTIELNGAQITISRATRTKDARGILLTYPVEEVRVSVSGRGVRATTFSAPANTAREWAAGILHFADECGKIEGQRRKGGA